MTEKKELLQANGKIDSCAIATRPDGTQIIGFKSDGVTPYTNYKYKIGGRFYSGFKSVEDYNIKRGDYCIVTYTENPNKDPMKKPYKNIVNIIQAVSPDEMIEEDTKVNLIPVGKTTIQPQATEDDRWDKINAVKDNKIMFGMVFNKTMEWIMNERKINKRVEGETEIKLDTVFDPTFDIIWKLANDKRKEVLE